MDHFVTLCVGVNDIWRTITCFVLPETQSNILPNAGLQLLLGLPWLYAVNAHIDIRNFTIEIGDENMGEKTIHVHGPELVFCKDHNVLLFPKIVLTPKHVEESKPKSESDWTENESAIDTPDKGAFSEESDSF